MRVYLDTYVFMDVLSGKPEFVQKAKQYIEKDGEKVVSSILFEELAFHVSRKNRSKADEILFYVQNLPIEIINVTPEIARLAGRIRAKYFKRIEKKLTYFDCIHIATAITSKCERFVTGDKGFRDVKEIEMEIY